MTVGRGTGPKPLARAHTGRQAASEMQMLQTPDQWRSADHTGSTSSSTCWVHMGHLRLMQGYSGTRN